MPHNLKVALLYPLIKQSQLDCESFKKFSSISNLAYISMNIEKVVNVRDPNTCWPSISVISASQHIICFIQLKHISSSLTMP